MKTRLFTTLSVLLVVAFMIASCSSPAPAPTTPPPAEEPTQEAPAPTTASMLETIRQRGRLVCGVHNELPGFGYIDSDGNNAGFDVDFCRAVAAAVLGDPAAVEYVPITAAERGPVLQTREVDLVSRNMTWTSSREAQWGNFTWIMFYDGQGMMVRADSGFTTLEDLNGATICVTTGTTTEQNLADAFREGGLEFTAVTFEDTSAVYGAYQDGRCDAATSDKSQLAAVRSGFPNPDEHFIMDVTISKEPLTPAVPSGDDQWKDIVTIVVWTLINAEEMGVTQANVADMVNSENVNIKRMLGAEGSFGQEDLGLDMDFAVNVIGAVGNYGEMYDRYMGPNGASFVLDRGLNNLWTNGGLLYAPPLK